MLCPKIFSSISKHHWGNWSSIFWYHWCYAQRSSRQVSKISDSTLKDLLLTFLTLCYSDLLFTFQTSSMRRSKIFSGLFSHSTRIDVMLVTSFLSNCTISDAMLEDLLFNSQACLMLLSTIFSSLVRHTWSYVPRSFLFLDGNYGLRERGWWVRAKRCGAWCAAGGGDMLKLQFLPQLIL